MTPTTAMPAAPLSPQSMPLIGRYRFEFQASRSARLNPYTGSMWRGAFGHALLKTVCVTREKTCEHCLLQSSCLYPYLFGSPVLSAQQQQQNVALPHPYALDVAARGPEQLQRGDILPLGVNLFGKSNQHLAYVIQSFRNAGRDGLGKERVPFELTQVQQWDGQAWHSIYQANGTLTPLPPTKTDIPACPQSAVDVTLHTPLRLKTNGHLVKPDNFQFATLAASLLRRISMISQIHQDTALELDYAALVHAARNVPIQQAQLQWHDWTRYSARQASNMQMGGLVGQFQLDGSQLDAFWAWLWTGQYTLVGKAATMGLGRYQLHIQPAKSFS